MIYSTLDGLRTHLAANCQCNVEIAPKDEQPDQYTLISLEPVGTGNLQRQNDSTIFMVMPLRIRVVDTKENEVKVLRTLDLLLRYIGTFEAYRGHDITGDIDLEYTDASQYQAVMQLNLKFDNHKEK